MKKLFVILFSNLLLSSATAFLWEDSEAARWAHNCNFIGNDFRTVRSGAAECGPFCYSDSTCSHFTWFDAGGGICYLKQGSDVLESRATRSNGAVCGLIKGRTNSYPPTFKWEDSEDARWAHNCDFPGKDFRSVRSSAAACGPSCWSDSTCSHFTWTNLEGGTCWLKKGLNVFECKATSNYGAVCGFIKSRLMG